LNLRLKTLLLSNASLTILLLGIAIGIRNPILGSFGLLEQNLMQKRLTRIADALVQHVEKLDSSAKAEAVWTEMYVYMVERTPQFYQNTYPFDGLATSNLDVFGLLDREGKPIHLDWVDRRSRSLKPVPNSIRADLLREKQLTRFPADNDSALGRSRNLAVVQTKGEPLLVAARPILTGDAKGPRQGTLLMGAFIDRKFLTQLEKYHDIQLHLIALPPVLPVAQQTPKSNLSTVASNTPVILKISPNIRVLDNQWVMGDIYLLNSEQKPIQALSVKAPRLEYQQGEQTLNQLTVVLFLVGTFLSIIISLLLDKSIRNQQLLKASETALQVANQELQQLANLDSLTQIANRRCFEQFLLAEWQRGIREQFALTLILCDVDYFKSFNDTYGHLAGDVCLYQIAQAIRRTVRQPGDLVARYGGEEFAVVLPNMNIEDGLCVAKAIQEEVRSLQIEHAGSPINSYVSISLGVSSTVPSLTTVASTLIELSDRQLYAAKQQGRNQIVFSTEKVF
jgi:diguanylate cyclase (GGDEF)-like protein